MLMRFAIFTVFLIFLSLCVAQFHIQGSETNQNKKPSKHNRQPLESELCMEGEYLYPGDNEKDWVCDCKPTYVYHPHTTKCHAVYSQGPCKKGEILALPPKKSVPKCERNTCLDNMVRFRGRCSRLNENGGCPYHLKLQVNATSLELTCALNLDSRFGEEDEPAYVPLDFNTLPVDEIGAFCVLGGKRSQNEKCNNNNPSTTTTTTENSIDF